MIEGLQAKKVIGFEFIKGRRPITLVEKPDGTVIRIKGPRKIGEVCQARDALGREPLGFATTIATTITQEADRPKAIVINPQLLRRDSVILSSIALPEGVQRVEMVVRGILRSDEDSELFVLEDKDRKYPPLLVSPDELSRGVHGRHRFSRLEELKVEVQSVQ